MTEASQPRLRERFDGFNYGYRMACECGQPAFITAETYARQAVNKARVPCDYCNGTVHFGPAAALLRNHDDPALDNQAVAHLAWYHTSTWPDWPSPDHRAQTVAALSGVSLERFFVSRAQMIERETTKALHVGTYEAGIENMLRRMRGQADARSQFYLYRVTLELDPERINLDYRDENAEEAAQLSTGQLDAANLDAIRYLNVHEATGSLSLAVRPQNIAAVQRLPIPVNVLAVALPTALSNRLEQLEQQLLDLRQEAVAVSNIEPNQLRRMELGLAPDPDGLGQLAQQIGSRQHELWNEAETALVQHHLPEVSPVICDDLTSAAATWRRGGVESVMTFADFFGAMAALLTRQRQVIDLVSRQP